MPFTPAHIWATSEQIRADDLSNNHLLARLFVNQDIEDTDLDTNLTTENIAVGEFFPINNSFLFETGEHWCFNKAAKELPLSERKYYSGTVKNSDMFGSVRFISIPDLSKEIFLAVPSVIIVTFGIHVRERQTGGARAYVQDDSSLSSSAGNNSLIRVVVNGNTLREETFYSFDEAEEINSFNPGGITITSNSVYAGADVYGQQNRRRFISGQIIIGDSLFPQLTRWHTIQIGIDPRNETACIIQANMSIEIFTLGDNINTSLPLIRNSTQL